MALALLTAVTSALPATALAAKSAKAAANPVASDLGDFVGRLRGFLPQTHFEWVDLGRTLLLHVDYWILIAVAYAFARRLTQLAADRKLRRVKAAMAYARHRDATYTSVETGMLEWINHLLRHEWRAVISAAVDEQARAAMERVMRDASRMSGGLVRRAVVEEATFGVVPPDLKLYVSRYNPGEDYLQFEFDFRWDTVSSHIVIKADVSAPSGGHSNALGGIPSALLSTFARAVPSVRVPIHVTDLSFAGRLLLGVRLSARAPGVSGLDVSFDGKPDVSVSVRPAGVPVNDIPGVRAFVEQKIGEVFAASYVEPKRYYHDVESLFLTKNLKGIPGSIDASAIGPNGALVVDVRNAERLPATSATTKASCPYLEVTYGGVTKRTPTRLNTTDPDWSTRLVFPLVSSEERLGGSRRRMSPLRVRVMDWSPLGEPRCIGAASQTVDLARLRAAAERAAAARPGDRARDAAGGALGLARYTLPLRGTRGGVLNFSLGAVGAVGASERANALGHRASRASEDRSGSDDVFHTDGLSPAGAFGEADDSRDLEDGDLEEDFEDDFGASAAPGMDEETRYVREESETTRFDHPTDPSVIESTRVGEGVEGVSRRRTDDASDPSGVGSDGSGGAAAAARLVRLAKVQRARREETEALHATVTRLTSKLETAVESSSMERERRGLELRRALVEGAAFTVHTKRKPGFDPGTYRLWYVASKKHIVWAKGAKSGTKPKLHQFVPVSLVKECVCGIDAFTLGADEDPAIRQSRDEAAAERAAAKKARKRRKKPGTHFFRGGPNPVRAVRRAARTATSLLVKKQIGNHDPARCFSLVLWKPDAVENSLSDTLLGSGAAGMGLATIDLELPDGGNGRGAREWCDAIMAVAEENGGGRLADPEEEEQEEEEDERLKLREGERALGGPGGDAEAIAAAAPPRAGAESRDTAPLRRQVSLPKRVSREDDVSEDTDLEMLTIPIPPDSVEDAREANSRGDGDRRA